MNPYRIEGPAMIQVSGGRTSAFMLRKILDAHDGKLPNNVIATFQNTGKEHEATLIFLKEISDEWNVPITWLEFTIDNGVKGFQIVNYCTASRNGEPFEALMRSRDYPPNPRVRYCTVELKLRTGLRFARSLGWEDFTRAVGLRADEPHRVARMKSDSANEYVVMPMAKAGHTLDDVMKFWMSQDFDLKLPNDDHAYGNCDLCFLKKTAKIEKILRSNPQRGEWWAKQEEIFGKPFRIDRPTYRQMLTQITLQGKLFDDVIDDDTLPCNCTD